ncbi:hypothetical protein C8Q80DRAFT_1276662 [Daedaleopsis nitida]|nr:hypothetical protein C8Q80DRAFT_1276662 [Daedaleopsis nitida]
MNNDYPSNAAVVLVAANKWLSFTVHGKILERFDPHLLDRMIAGSTSQTVIIGPGAKLCPVQLSDTEFDLTHFIHLVYGKQSIDDHTPFEVLAAWLRMAAKYNIDHLALDIIARLKHIFPTTLSAWDARDKYRRSHSFEETDVFQAFNLLRMLGDRYGALELVPAALYSCCQIGTQALNVGGMRNGLTPETLSPSDYELVLRAKARLRVWGATLVGRFALFTTSPDCVRPSKSCMKFISDFVRFPDVIQEGFEAVRDMLAGDVFNKAFLRYIRSWHLPGFTDPFAEEELCSCSECLSATYDQYNALRTEAWTALPVLAGVPLEKLPDWGCSDLLA